MLGKIEGKRRSRRQRMRCLGSITDSTDMSLSKLEDSEGKTGKSGVPQSTGSQRTGHGLVTEQQHRSSGVTGGCRIVY